MGGRFRQKRTLAELERAESPSHFSAGAPFDPRVSDATSAAFTPPPRRKITTPTYDRSEIEGFDMPHIANRMMGVDMSGIRKMFELASKDSINFGIGEPDFQPPDHVIDAYAEALRNGHNSYGPSSGIMELRQAIVERERSRVPDLTPNEVIVTAGSTNALYGTMQAFVNPGEEVLCPDPGFVLYGPHVRLANGVPRFYPLEAEHGFIPQIEDLEERVSPRTKAIVMNTPSNPTGSTIPMEKVREIVAFAKRHDLIIITDEAYDQITYDSPHASFLGQYDKVIYLNTFSKTYAMTGWRIGYVVTNPQFADAIRKMNYHLMACPPTPTQHACLAALTGPQDFVENMAREFKGRRDLVTRLANEVPGWNLAPPGGAFYAFPRYDMDIASRDLAMEILKAGVVTIPGEAFGLRGQGHIRISYATSEEKLVRGFEIIRKTVDGLIASPPRKLD